MTSKTPHLIFGCANAGWGIICALMAANCLRITAVAKTNNVRNLALGLFMIYTIAGITSGTAAIQKFKYASKLPKSGGREP